MVYVGEVDYQQRVQQFQQEGMSRQQAEQKAQEIRKGTPQQFNVGRGSEIQAARTRAKYGKPISGFEKIGRDKYRVIEQGRVRVIEGREAAELAGVFGETARPVKKKVTIEEALETQRLIREKFEKGVGKAQDKKITTTPTGEYIIAPSTAETYPPFLNEFKKQRREPIIKEEKKFKKSLGDVTAIEGKPDELYKINYDPLSGKEIVVPKNEVKELVYDPNFKKPSGLSGIFTPLREKISIWKREEEVALQQYRPSVPRQFISGGAIGIASSAEGVLKKPLTTAAVLGSLAIPFVGTVVGAGLTATYAFQKLSDPAKTFTPRGLGETAGEMLFFGSLAKGARAGGNILKTGYKNVRTDISIARYNKRMKGKLITRETTLPAKISRDVSVEVRGRPIESFSGVETVRSGRAGTFIDRKLSFNLGKLQPVDLTRTPSKLSIIGVTQSRTVIGKTPVSTVKTTLPITTKALQRSTKTVVEQTTPVKLTGPAQPVFETLISGGFKTRQTNQGVSFLSIKPGKTSIKVRGKAILTKGTPRETVRVSETGGVLRMYEPRIVTERNIVPKGRPRPSQEYYSFQDQIVGGLKPAISGREIRVYEGAGGLKAQQLFIYDSARVMRQSYGTTKNPVAEMWGIKERKPIISVIPISKTSKVSKPNEDVIGQGLPNQFETRKGQVLLLKSQAETQKAKQKTKRRQEQVLVTKQRSAQSQVSLAWQVPAGREQAFKNLASTMGRQGQKTQSPLAQALYGRTVPVTAQRIRTSQSQKQRIDPITGLVLTSASSLSELQASATAQSLGLKTSQSLVLSQSLRTAQQSQLAQKSQLAQQSRLATEQSLSQLLERVSQSRTSKRSRRDKIRKPGEQKVPSQDNTVKKMLLGSEDDKKGFQVLIKRKGRFFALPGVYTRESAKDALARVLGQTLAATGKLKRTGKRPTITKETSDFERLAGSLRSYQIRKGKRIPLEDVWIQKRGSRLSGRGERKEIKAAKRQSSFIKTRKGKSSKKNGGSLKWL